MQLKKVLVLSTAACGLAVLLFGGIYQSFQNSKPVVLETVGFPSIGNRAAKVEVVVIEDFLCCNCKEFTLRVFPQIQSRYIEPGEVRFTIVPVAFIAGSKPIANAALEVFWNAPDRFFPFVEEILPHCQAEKFEGVSLIQIAEKVGGIDLVRLQECIDSDCHYWELEKNLQWAQAVMGKDFGTPALYVNGKPTSTRTFELVQERIEQVLHETR